MMKKLLLALLILILPLTALGVESRRGFIETYDDQPPPGEAVAPPVLEELESDGTDEESAPFMDDDDLSFLDEDDEVVDVYDPLETFNRGIFWFNDKAYFYVMKPLAKGWRWLAPEPLRLGIRNFFSNLRAPIRFVNAALQGKFRDAGNELTRFGVNSTLGIGGLFDTAKGNFGVERKIEDTGQTLAHYGVGPGPYLVLPFLGPSNVRDGIGLLGDVYFSLVPVVFENRGYWIAVSGDVINFLSIDKDTYEGIKRDSLDPYLFLRDAYSQYRSNLILH
ncbi:MAG: VacJ family lipoprotein [Gammaproteobacteria bacterium]|jgi:phospholipid-binding lipoprotein MlaA